MLEFQALDWREFNEDLNVDEDDDSDNSDDGSPNEKYIIRVFGRTIDDKSVTVKILNYTPHFYIQLPTRYNDTIVNDIIKILKEKAGRYKHNLVSYDIVERFKFRYFTNETKFKFLRLIFDNSRAMYIFSNNVKYNLKLFNDRYKVPASELMDRYESNIDSFLRCIHMRDVLTCGWIQVNKYENNEGNEASTCDINIKCDWKNISPAKDQNRGAPFRINSFDIECYSHDGQFPQGYDIRNPVIQIGNVFGKYGKDIYKKIILTLKSCDPIDDGITIVRSYNTERELLLGWIEMLKEEDPDVLIGYNIWQFDENYLAERCKLQEINCAELFSRMSKICRYSCPFIKKQVSSAGMGDNFIKYYESYGRVQCDLMKYMQTRPEFKLSKWTLDTVAETYIQETIKSYNILSADLLEIESKELHLLQVGNYVKIISQLELEYGLHEEKEVNSDDENEEYCKEKYRIVSINGNKMVITHNEVKFTKEGMEELGKELKWGLVKDDIKANDIFRMQTGTSADRKTIADYCLQDCVLVYRLFVKLDVLTNLIGMANVCHVPLYYLLIRGQGIKSLSLVSKECRKQGYLIPVLEKDAEDDSTFSGAVVFEPKTGFYQRPIVVKDYNSLYPSSIISRNVSHETIVKDAKYDNLPGYIYYDVQYPNDDGTITKCRYAKQYKLDENGEDIGKRGIIPSILQHLLKERKDTKKLMEKEEDKFKKSILDGKQNALKVTANSIYGQLGAKVGPLYLLELASSTTAIGRVMLETAQKFVENDLTHILQAYAVAFKNNDDAKIKELNDTYLKDSCDNNVNHIRSVVKDFFENYEIKPKVVYGDSCTGDTPIMLLNNGNLEIKRIDDFTTNEITKHMWRSHDLFKNNDNYNLALSKGLIDPEIKHRYFGNYTDKMSYDCCQGLKIWTGDKWSNVRRIIRHKTDKSIYRVLTHSGSVDVTEDHSLLTPNKTEIKPIDCQVGTELLHGFPNTFNCIEQLVSVEEAFILGCFVANGSCEVLNSEHGVKYTWQLASNDLTMLDKCLGHIRIAEPKFNFEILSHRLVPIGPVEEVNSIVLKYKSLCYDSTGAKIIPNSILCNTVEVKAAFLDGLLAANGRRDQIDTENKTTAQMYYYILKSMGHNVYINDGGNNSNMIRITWYVNEDYQKSHTVITDIYKLHDRYDDHVYDIETEEGVFHAGIGSMIIKNTDSIFCDLEIKNKATNEYIIDKSALIKAIAIGKASSMLIKKRLPFPHNLEYEKTLYPFCLMAKKRYTANKYEDNPNKFKQIVMGIALKRRDNANIVKKIYGGLVNITLNENNIVKAVQYVENSLQKVLDGKYPISDFITTKTLKSKYKGIKVTTDSSGQAGTKGLWNWDDVQCSLAHVKLCQRIKERDPGNVPSANDRVAYVAIYKEKKKGVKLLQGDIIDTPEYIKENNKRIDYLYYITNQLEEPIVQFLEHLINRPRDIFKKYIEKEEVERCKNTPNSLFRWTTPKEQNEAINKNDIRYNVESLDTLYDGINLRSRTFGNVPKKPKTKISKAAKNINDLYN
jgi:DNA polymerase elongation subunit (family B)